MTGAPANSRFFTREGPTVLCCQSRRDFDPPPGGTQPPRPRPVGTGLSRKDIVSGLHSVLVLRGVIFLSGFDAVVAVTEALPVALIPEENTVSSVRLDVINIGCLNVATCLHALHTQRMRFKVMLAGSVPSHAVPSASSGACVLRVESTVFVTVLGAVWYKRRTTGMPARRLWSAWH